MVKSPAPVTYFLSTRESQQTQRLALENVVSPIDILQLPPHLVEPASPLLCCSREVREKVNPRSLKSDVLQSSGCIHRPLAIAEVMEPCYYGAREPGRLRTLKPVCPLQLDATRLGVELQDLGYPCLHKLCCIRPLQLLRQAYDP